MNKTMNKSTCSVRQIVCSIISKRALESIIVYYYQIAIASEAQEMIQISELKGNIVFG